MFDEVREKFNAQATTEGDRSAAEKLGIRLMGSPMLVATRLCAHTSDGWVGSTLRP